MILGINTTIYLKMRTEKSYELFLLYRVDKKTNKITVFGFFPMFKVCFSTVITCFKKELSNVLCKHFDIGLVGTEKIRKNYATIQ